MGVHNCSKTSRNDILVFQSFGVLGNLNAQVFKNSFLRPLMHSCDKFSQYLSFISSNENLSNYLNYLLSEYNIRKSAKQTGMAIQTASDWLCKLSTSFS